MDARNAYEYHGARAAPVAQLDRVLPSEGRGRGFESRLVHHTAVTRKPQAVGSGAFLHFRFGNCCQALKHLAYFESSSMRSIWRPLPEKRIAHST